MGAETGQKNDTGKGNLTTLDKWTAAAKNHPLGAAIILCVALVSGIAGIITSIEVFIKFWPTAVAFWNPPDPVQGQNVSAALLDSPPGLSRHINVLIDNAGSETAVVEFVALGARVKADGGAKIQSIAVFFPVGGHRVFGPGASEILQLAPSAKGMFLISEPQNPEFIKLYRSIPSIQGQNPDMLHERLIMTGECDMSVRFKFASNTKKDILPDITCSQLWPLVQAEFAAK